MKRKEIAYLLLYGLIILCSLSSCDKADNVDDWKFNYPVPTFDTSTQMGKIQKELYDAYHVYFTPVFDDTFYKFDWAFVFDAYDKIEITEEEYVHTADYLHEMKKVLKEMPPFVVNRLPSYVLLVDSLRNQYNLKDKNYEVAKSPVRAVVGDNKTNFIVFGFGGKSFPKQNIDELRESWTALFFERALSGYKAPEEFSNIVNEQKNGRTKGYSLTSLWTPDCDMANYGFLKESYLRRTKITEGNIDAKGEITKLNYYGEMKEQQDISLFIAFTMFCPAEKKAEIYSLSEVFAQKEEIVKDICSNELHFELKPINLR